MTRHDSTRDADRSLQRSSTRDLSHGYFATRRTIGVNLHYSARDRVSAELFEQALAKEFLRIARQVARQKRHHVRVQSSAIDRRSSALGHA